MAAPITSIRKREQTEDERTQKKLNDLQGLLADNEEALNSIFSIIGELNNMGALEAANSALQAKEDIMDIALHQASREPVTNVLNHLLNTAGILSSMDPEMINKLASSITAGIEEANEQLHNNKPLHMLDLLKVLKDPDITRAGRFGLHFLIRMGMELKEEE